MPRQVMIRPVAVERIMTNRKIAHSQKKKISAKPAVRSFSLSFGKRAAINF
jgi:hypothetical protein